jgi:hypothetical protein
MTDLQVFIPSRGRWEGARKIADAWHKQKFNVTFVVEPNEALKYASVVQDCRVDVLQVKNAGIGNSRNHCVNLAASYGYESFILADDDIKPLKNANMDILQEDAEDPKVLGITARYGYHDLALGPEIKKRRDLILLPTGTFRLVALNTMNVLNLGNYDHTLEYAEDCDLFLRGLEAGFPWMVHLGTWSTSVGTRYQPGGMIDYVGDMIELQDKKRYWHETLYQQYPDWVNDPTRADFTKQNSIRIAWQRAYNHFLPDWREWSALHGGDIERYFDAS